MRLRRFHRFAPVLVMLAAVGASLFLFAHAPAVRADCGNNNASPPQSPCPTPTNAFLSLDVTAGDANTVINVTGGQFLSNTAISLYWDTPNKVAGSANADGNGNFNARVKPFSGDAPGVHKLCASQGLNPCANFTINAPPTSPSPSPTPTESPSPTPQSSPTDTSSPTPAAATLNGFDVISKPPFVFLPVAGAFAIALAIIFWIVSMVRRPRVTPLPSAAVVHRAMRPDYSAGFGAPPSKPAPASAEPSAWPDVPAPEAAPPAAPPEPASEIEEVEWGPPVEWGTGSSDWGFPEPPPEEDAPETPQPGD